LGQVRAHNQAGVFQWLGPGPEIFARIAKVYAKLPTSVYLRATDAIHLATAAEAGFQFVYSNDAHLLAAATHFGIEGRNVIGRTS